jgi:hypothetical protein
VSAAIANGIAAYGSPPSQKKRAADEALPF